mgnify:CR=1 FL=1
MVLSLHLLWSSWCMVVIGGHGALIFPSPTFIALLLTHIENGIEIAPNIWFNTAIPIAIYLVTFAILVEVDNGEIPPN